MCCSSAGSGTGVSTKFGCPGFSARSGSPGFSASSAVTSPCSSPVCCLEIFYLNEETHTLLLLSM